MANGFGDEEGTGPAGVEAEASNNDGQEDLDIDTLLLDDEDTDSGDKPASEEKGKDKPVDATNQPSAVLDRVLDALQFDEVLTEKVLKDLDAGDATAFNKAIHDSNRAAVKQTLMLTSQMMQQMNVQISKQIELQVAGLLKSTSTKASLNQELKTELGVSDGMPLQNAARIFNKAMKQSKGNKAVGVGLALS